MGQFDGKVAVVTGAARGIGRSIAERLASEGADVVICDLQAEWLAETASAIQALGRKALPLAVNVGNGESVTACIAEVIKVFGKVDIMVNNAGITKDTLLVRMSDEDWDAVLQVNLKGT
ncbi:MAG: SDR family NAD(P)-dependent oxidoreductase, partial [bacterium]